MVRHQPLDDVHSEVAALAHPLAEQHVVDEIAQRSAQPAIQRHAEAHFRPVDDLVGQEAARDALQQILLLGPAQLQVGGQSSGLLHHDVDIFVLDEPTRGIDVGSKAQIYKLIDQLVAREPGDATSGGRGRRAKAILIVSSYLPELLGLCDRIAVMSRGRLGPARPVGEWNEHSLLMDASGARAAS